jgi:hypothetical protein
MVTNPKWMFWFPMVLLDCYGLDQSRGTRWFFFSMVRYLTYFYFWVGLSLSTLLGGGYVMPLSKGHLDWMEHVRNEASASGIELNVCLLEYGAF